MAIAEKKLLYVIPDRSLPGSIPNPHSPDFDILPREKKLLDAVIKHGPGEEVAAHLEHYLRGGGKEAYYEAVDEFHRLAIGRIAKSLDIAI